MRPIRIMLVEHHLALAEGLAFALRHQKDFDVVGIARTLGDGTALAEQTNPDVALIAFHLPDGTGAQLTAALRARQPQIAIVILTADSREQAVLAAIEAGVCGYLLKTQPLPEIIQALRRAAEGELMIPAAALVQLVTRQSQRLRAEGGRIRQMDSLTPREIEILRLLARGRDSRTIADELMISYATVRGHVQNILVKLEAHTRLEAVARAAELGIIDPHGSRHDPRTER